MRDRARSAFVWTAVAGVLAASLPGAALAAAPPKTAQKAPAKASPKAPKADPMPVSDETARLIGWVKATKDNGDLPFAVVDKFNAVVFVFDADGKLQGQAPEIGRAHV